jgi:hypothetical protein
MLEREGKRKNYLGKTTPVLWGGGVEEGKKKPKRN